MSPIDATLVAQKIPLSGLFADYQRAFVEASGLPLRFVPAQETAPQGIPFRGHPAENPFCALIAKSAEGCRMCRGVDERLQEAASGEPKTERCLAGLVDTAVPVFFEQKLLGYLRTGQVALEPRGRGAFKKVAQTLIQWGLETDLSRLEDSWFHSRVLEKIHYEAFTRLLQVFARHLGLAAGQIPVASVSAEAPTIQKARAFISANQHDELRVQDVAKVVNMSVFYFCKVFKRATGKTFTEYLAAVRIAKAKNLLLNPHARITEVAFQSGFQSITHFNRVFLKLVGQSPSAYRKGLLHSAS